MPTFTVYSAPTNANPNRAIVSVPDVVQLDTQTSTFSVQEAQPITSQTNAVVQQIGTPTIAAAEAARETGFENVIAPSNSGLFGSVEPVLAPQVLDADKNLLEISLLPNSALSILPNTEGVQFPIPPLVNRVTIPDGYVPVENMSALERYAYGIAYKVSDQGFKLLQGTKPPPEKLIYGISPRKGGKIIVFGSGFVDSVRIDWMRLDRTDRVKDWTTFGNFSVSAENNYQTTAIWDTPGEFVLRIIPFHRGYPLSEYKQRQFSYVKESDNLRWTYIQRDMSSFQFRLEGTHEGPANYIAIYEGTKLLSESRLLKDNEGYVSQIFEITGISNKKSPLLKIKWYKRLTTKISYLYSENMKIHRNYAAEDISLSVIKPSNSQEFRLTIKDPQALMYSPPTVLDAFDNTGWFAAVQSQKMMVYLEICTHQLGEKKSYGYYALNITQGKNPQFLEEVGFSIVKKIRGGFEFTWEDTSEFRQLANVDAPDLTKPIMYEFRLLFWSCGVDESVRRNTEYFWRKETAKTIAGQQILHAYAYNSWVNEHPSAKYVGLNPSRLSKFNKSHVQYGRSMTCSLVEGVVPKIEITKNINIEPLGWQVLYQIDHDAQDVKEFPFYSMNIRIPATTQDHINNVRVFLAESNIEIGRYHPTEAIHIVDFLGHYMLRKSIVESMDLSSLFATIESVQPERKSSPLLENDFKNSRMIAPVQAPALNTRARRLSNAKMTRSSNRAVATKAKEEFINYKIVIEFNNGEIKEHPVRAPLSAIPSIPEEPSDNTAFSLGNPVIAPDAMNIDPIFENNLASTIQNSNFLSPTPIENTSVMIPAVGDGFGVLR